MKQILTIIIFCVLPLGAISQDIKFTISDGISNVAVKERMEMGIHRLLCEINEACAQERTLRLDNIDMALGGKKSLQYLWQNLHFFCEDNEILERCLTSAEGYVIRNIYIQVNPMIADYDEEREL